jgi:hypothetical protein
MAVHFFDIYAAIGLGLVCVPIIAWLGILFNHHKTLKVGTERVQVLIVRNSLFLPTYAFLLWLSLILPPLFPILEGPIAIAEGEEKGEVAAAVAVLVCHVLGWGAFGLACS